MQKIFIQFPIKIEEEKEAIKTVREQLPYIVPGFQSAVTAGDSLEITFQADEKVQISELEEKVKQYVEKTFFSFSRVKTEIFRSHDGSPVNSNDPLEDLQKMGWVSCSSPGSYSYSGQFLRLFLNLDNYVKDMAIEMGSVEHYYPATVSLESMVRNGYLQAYPQNAFFLFCLQHRSEVIDGVSQLKSKVEKDWGAFIGSHSAQGGQVMAPTVCYHCFSYFSDKKIEGNMTVTARNLCFRHEGGAFEGLLRLQTYSMREIIFFGSDDFVRTQFQATAQKIFDLLVRLDVKCRLVSATDPFFSTGQQNKRIFQSTLNLKNELQVYIPYCDRWISVASFNHHQKSLVGSYGIEGQGDLQSGCMGVGLDRLAFGLFSQFGLDASKWNSEFARLLRD